MSTQSLQDLLGGLKQTFGDRIETLASGGTPNSDWDGPPLPLTNEYRVQVDTAEYKPSKATGKNQFVITYVIQEPEQYKGRKIQDYITPTPTNEAASRSLADAIGSLRLSLEGWGEDWDGFIKQAEGRTAVVTLRTWGEANDRYSVRWINGDIGQTLKTTITPQKAKTNTNNLRPDIVIPKTDEATAPVQQPASPQLPGAQSAPRGGSGGGPNLPPGLG